MPVPTHTHESALTRRTTKGRKRVLEDISNASAKGQTRRIRPPGRPAPREATSRTANPRRSRRISGHQPEPEIALEHETQSDDEDDRESVCEDLIVGVAEELTFDGDDDDDSVFPAAACGPHACPPNAGGGTQGEGHGAGLEEAGAGAGAGAGTGGGAEAGAGGGAQRGRRRGAEAPGAISGRRPSRDGFAPARAGQSMAGDERPAARPGPGAGAGDGSGDGDGDGDGTDAGAGPGAGAGGGGAGSQAGAGAGAGGGTGGASGSGGGAGHGAARSGAADRWARCRMLTDSAWAPGQARPQLPPGVCEIDAEVGAGEAGALWNPDYTHEYQAWLRSQQGKNRPRAYIPGRQRDMKHNMRSILVDWIVEVCEEFKMATPTLFLIVELVDRALSKFEVARSRLQLLGCACILLASKHEEIYPPTVDDLVHISDNTYKRGDIIEMELRVMRELDFRLHCITPCFFLERFCRAAKSNRRERSLARYLLELLLQDYHMLEYPPSLKAAAAVNLACQTLRSSAQTAWTAQARYYTGYAAQELEECVRRLHALHLGAEAHSLRAVRDKYTRSGNHRVSEVTCLLADWLCFDGR